MWEIHTIGYSPHTPESFVELLHKHGVTAVADVRSNPYSKFKPDFNKESIEAALRKSDIAYVFLGDRCGARPNDAACYRDNRVSFELLAKQSAFRQGIQRLREAMQRFNVALMCAEKDPVDCHRMVLVSRELARDRDVKVRHILGDGTCEEQPHAEQRLLARFDLDAEELPGFGRSFAERLDEAYARQAQRIAYHEQEDKQEALETRHV